MKTSSRQGAKAPKGETCKVNLTLSVEAYRRLFVTSVMGGQTASAIVEGLISEGLRSWSMPGNLTDRASKRQPTTSVVHDAPVEIMASEAA
jgi:hypothetical protein